ncbi:hypothetical protein Tco_0019277 [Tanacetum coccineum]
MPYPSRKIRRIRACTHQRPQRNKDQYAVSRKNQYAVFKIWNQYNILKDIKRGPYSKKSSICLEYGVSTFIGYGVSSSLSNTAYSSQQINTAYPLPLDTAYRLSRTKAYYTQFGGPFQEGGYRATAPGDVWKLLEPEERVPSINLVLPIIPSLMNRSEPLILYHVTSTNHNLRIASVAIVRKKHKKKVSSVKLGRNKDEGTLSEEHYVQEEDTADPFFDNIADKDAAVTPDLERKSDETEEVYIEEKEASNVKSGETEELDLETTQSMRRQGTITPRILNFEDEADQMAKGILVEELKEEINIFNKSEPWKLQMDEEECIHVELEDGPMIHMLAVKERYTISRELLLRMLDHGWMLKMSNETAFFDTICSSCGN